MKKVLFLTVVMFAAFAAVVLAQDKAPSYFEMDDYNHRYPETDTKIDLYLRSWKNSPVYSGSSLHGGWIERPYLTTGDPLNPPRPGAVLKYMVRLLRLRKVRVFSFPPGSNINSLMTAKSFPWKRS